MSDMHLHSHYHLQRMQEMGKVYWCHGVSSFGISLVTIFVPIFLLKIGYSFRTVLVYLFLQGLFSLILQIPTGFLFRYLSSHSLLVIGSLFYAVFLGLLGTLQSQKWSLALLALVWALNRTVYWPAFHYTFGIARAHEKAGRQIAGINALILFVHTTAPAIGGILATIFGIKYLYFAAAGLIIIAVIPILKSSQAPPKAKFKITWREIWRMRRDTIANVFNGTIITTELNIWPLLVFIIVGSYATVGNLSSIIALAGILITLFIGRKEDLEHGKRKYWHRGIATYSITNIGRAVVQNTAQIFGLNLLAGIGRSLSVTPFMNRYYSNSDCDFRLGYVITMETAFALGSTLFMLTLLILTTTFSEKVVLSIGLASISISTIGIRLIR